MIARYGRHFRAGRRGEGDKMLKFLTALAVMLTTFGGAAAQTICDESLIVQCKGKQCRGNVVFRSFEAELISSSKENWRTATKSLIFTGGENAGKNRAFNIRKVTLGFGVPGKIQFCALGAGGSLPAQEVTLTLPEAEFAVYASAATSSRFTIAIVIEPDGNTQVSFRFVRR
jgi:hypothetical protein